MASKNSGGMTIIQSDIEEISLFIIDELAKRKIDLNEAARGVLISQAIGYFKHQGIRMMRELIAWEIEMLAPVNMARGTDRAVSVAPVDKMRKVDAVKSYLNGIGCRLFKTSREYYTVIPKSYNMANVQTRLREAMA